VPAHGCQGAASVECALHTRPLPRVHTAWTTRPSEHTNHQGKIMSRAPWVPGMCLRTAQVSHKHRTSTTQASHKHHTSMAQASPEHHGSQETHSRPTHAHGKVASMRSQHAHGKVAKVASVRTAR